MSPASLNGRFLLTKQVAGSNLPPRCSAVLKLLCSFFQCLKTGEKMITAVDKDKKEMSFCYISTRRSFLEYCLSFF